MFGRKINNNKYIIATVIILLISIKISLTKKYNINQNSLNNAISATIESTPESPDEVKRQMIESIVMLSYYSGIPSIMNLEESSLDKMSSATGFSIGYDEKNDISLVITNDHFCERIILDPTSIVMAEKSDVARISDMGARGMIGDVLYTSPEYDLCIIEVFGKISGARLASQDYRPAQFDRIYIIGAPSGVLPIIVETFFSADLRRGDISIGSLSKRGEPFLLTSDEVFPGHSGSPIFNESGEVIGVIFASLPSYGGIGIPISDVYKFLYETNRIITKE